MNVQNNHVVTFGDISREYRAIRQEIDDVVARVLAGGCFVLGPEVLAFEKEFAAKMGVAHCVAVASGTEAIAVALMACGVGQGHEVITVSNTAVPTVAAILMVGARPRMIDCESGTGLMNVSAVAQAMTSLTRAIVPVHLYGQCVDMEPLMRLSLSSNIPVIEDCAQAHGATYRGRLAGSLGLMGCFSFYPSKNLGCYGDGGAVVTSDGGLAETLAMVRNYGQRQRYVCEMRGINSRLDEIQAAILRVKLKHLSDWNQRRRELAGIYSRELSGLPLVLPVEKEGCCHVYHLYVVQAEKRDALQAHLDGQGIKTLIHYPIPVHRQKGYDCSEFIGGDLSVTERIAGRILSLPIYPHMEDWEVMRVTKAIRGYFES